MLFVASALAGSAGLAVGPLAYKGPARHDLRPAIGAWGRSEVGPLTITGELLGAWRFRDAIEHRVVLGRASVAAGVGTGGEHVHVGIGLGPALVLRTGSAAGYGFTRANAALRIVSHFDLRLGRTPLVVRYQLGSTTRGPFAWDFDATGGVGVWW